MKDISHAIAKRIKFVLARKPICVIALCGGRSAIGLCKALMHETIPWERVHFFIVDERRVPLSDPESNFGLFVEHLFAKIAIPHGNLHPFVGDDPKVYGAELARFSNAFDIVFLSAGEDGHVAGLYPHHPLLTNKEDFIVFDDSPKPPPKRMSSSVELLARSGYIVLLFSETKKHAYKLFCHSPSVQECPARLVLDVPHAIFTQFNR